jgi:TM2 domain-containing membrane protein YozV
VEVEEKEQTIPVYPPPKDESISECSRGIYIGLAIFFGALGVHNFYANRTNIAIAQALISILTFWSIVIPICVWIIAIFESVSITRDGEGRVFKGA